jgi:hypothetical protein
MSSTIRFLIALVLAVSLVFLMLWIGSWIATTVSQPHRQYNDFTVGRKMDLCGYQVDMRHVGGGYDLQKWEGERCDSLSELDGCLLDCLSKAGTIEIGAACYSDCLGD